MRNGFCDSRPITRTDRLAKSFRSTDHPQGGGGLWSVAPRARFRIGTDSHPLGSPLIESDVMAEFNLQDAIAILTRTPATLDALLRGLPETWTHQNEGGGTWTAYLVVGHLIHGEREDWIQRARGILEHGDTRAF